MILTCPNCGTQYVVKDGAVPPQGRQVRCANCKHSWHQDPDPNADAAGIEPVRDEAMRGPVPTPSAPEAEGSDVDTGAGNDAPQASEPTPDEYAAAGRIDDEPAPEDESLAEATLIEPRSGPEAEQRAYEEAMIGDGPVQAAPAEETREQPEAIAPGGRTGDTSAALAASRSESLASDTSDAPSGFSADDDAGPIGGTTAASMAAAAAPAAFTSNYDAPPTAEPVRDEFSPFAEREPVARRGRSALVTIAMLVVAIAVLAAAFWFLAPAEWRARAGLGDAGKTPLELMITHPDRQKLASGQESLTISGRVINPTDATHAIPPIYAQLKSRSGQLIYSWTIAPPAPSLGPRASTSFNSTEVDVPPGGDDLTISLGSPKA